MATRRPTAPDAGGLPTATGPTAPNAVPGDVDRGESRPSHASEGQWDQSLFPRPDGVGDFNVDWQIERLPGGGTVAGNPTGMSLFRRIRGMGLTGADEDRNP